MDIVERQYECVKQIALERNLTQTLSLLPYIVDKHKGQYRAGEEKIPYVVHPLTMAMQALSMGIDDDDLISVALLHDVCEDCGVSAKDLPANERTKHSVALLTKKENFCKTRDNEAYYKAIAEDEIASMVKIIDRCNNISTMAGAFSIKKMKKYLKETKEYVYPLYDSIIKKFPGRKLQASLLYYHMEAVLYSMENIFKKIGE